MTLAVITGASSGIGLELARLFAADDYDLIVCAEDDGITTAAGQLDQLGRGHVSAVKQNLRTYEGVENLVEQVRAAGQPVDAAAINAGVGRGGAFVETELEDELAIVELNCASTVHLAKRLLADMVARDEGKVLFTSSIASTMPGSFQAVYNASKSFVQSLAEALQDELKDTGVTITSLMPGPTETNFFRRAGMADNTRVGRSESKDDPADVARMGYEALLAGKRRVVAASMSTKAQEAVGKVLPDRVKAAMHRAMAKPQ